MNVRFILLVLVLLVAGAVVAGCTQYGTQTPKATVAPTPVETQSPGPVTTQPPGTSLPVATAPANSLQATATPQTTVTTVHIRNFAFVPATLTVLPGTQITWVNDDDVPHTVVATGNASGMFQSQTLRKGDEFQYTFGSVGTYEYICSIHPSMHGTIIVKEGADIVGA